MKRLYRLYFILPSLRRLGLLGKSFDYLCGIVFKRFFDSIIPQQFARNFNADICGINRSEIRKIKYIVSLTSFPARINEVWICIDSLMRQTFKPDKIILWLADSQFPDRVLPESLRKYEKKGLSICWCDDLRSYKKFFYTIQEYPEDNIITVDDDIYYPSDMLENLVNLNFKYPNCVCANRVHLMTFDKNGELKSYRNWIHNYRGLNLPSLKLFVTGIGGVLYPPHCFVKDIINIQKAREICPLADDVWLNFCALSKETRIIGSNKYNKDFICVGHTQNEKLVAQNVLGGGNDMQIKSVLRFLNLQLSE